MLDDQSFMGRYFLGSFLDFCDLSPGTNVTFVNFYSYDMIRGDADALNGVDFIYCDGVVMSLLASLVLKKRIPRLSFDMTSVAPMLFDYCVENNKKIFFVGAKEKEVEDSVSFFKKKYPELNVCGYSDGYFQKKSRDDVVAEIVDRSPDFVVAGMGAVNQERFLKIVRDSGWRGVGFTCGGFFHQTSMAGGYYYPRVVDKLNLRWVYRFLIEPDTRKRYLIDYPLFLFKFIFRK